jgi:uncharacterized membrane protein YkvI
MIGGGYGTGREIVEYFGSFGFLGGLMAMSLAFATLATILALSFEFARHFQVFDYRNFFKLLLGRGWAAFEILIVFQFLIVLAVLASAAGNILRDSFGMPYGVGLLLMLGIVGLLTFFGRELIVKVLTYWSVFLYVVFIAFFVTVLINAKTPFFGEHIIQTRIAPGWWTSGFKYALYNVAAVPLLLYVARGFKTRAEAMGSGVIAASIAMVPALLFHVVFIGYYPEIINQPIPVYWIMTNLGMSAFILIYSIMLFGTFIETGAGMLQGINERIDAYFLERRGYGATRAAHASLAVLGIVLSAFLSLFGITSLIAQGYGTMAWGFLAVYIIPLTTIGIWRISRNGHQSSSRAAL